jgi:hypothetical protein
MQWWEYFLLPLLARPFRCEGCLIRLYGFVWVRSKPRDSGMRGKGEERRNAEGGTGKAEGGRRKAEVKNKELESGKKQSGSS